MPVASPAAGDPGRWPALLGVNTRRLVAASGLLALVTLAACSASDGSNSGPDVAATNSEVVGSPVTATDITTTDTATNTDTATTTDTADEPASKPEGVQPSGFTTVRATITDPDGDECEVCLWLADTPDERGRGLMGVTDLGDAVGMAFVFEAPTNGAFYMFQTPTPLSIAWFGVDGAWVASAEMEPCIDTPANECPLYNPGAAYDLAIEVFAAGTERQPVPMLPVPMWRVSRSSGSSTARPSCCSTAPKRSTVRPLIHDDDMNNLRAGTGHCERPGRSGARSRYRGAVHIGPAPATGLPAPHGGGIRREVAHA